MIKKHQFFSQPDGVYIEGPIIKLAERYTHTSGDTIFHYQNNQFSTLFNFGASIGDQWIIDNEYQMTGCNLESIVEVIGKDNIDINGTFRRAIHLEILDGSPLKMNGWVVENIRPIGSQYLFPTNINCYDSTIVDFEEYNFKCFQDPRIDLYNPSNTDCEYLRTLVGLTDLKNEIFKIYPYPTSDILNIYFKRRDEYQMTILDYSGRVILEKKFSKSKEKINLDKLQKGIYLMRINNNDDIFRTERIIKK